MAYRRIFLLIIIVIGTGVFYNQSVKDKLTDIDYEVFNKLIYTSKLENKEWIYNPGTVALMFAGGIEQGVRRDVDIEEGESGVIVTIIEDNYQDDSVSGAKYVIQLVQDADSAWYIKDAKWGQKCWTGRGHINYSCESCR